MTAKRVALVTASRLPEGMEDTAQLAGALREHGAHVELAVWSDKAVDWDGFEAILLHSPWDYSERIEDFLSWLREVAFDGRTLNSYQLIAWNSDKRYLGALENQGIALPRSLVFECGRQVTAKELAERFDSAPLVVKPVVAAGGRRMWLCPSLEEASRTANQRLPDEPIFVQAYERAVETTGEYSAIYFQDQLSHVVLKVPQSGEYRVQSHYGGKAYPVDPEPWIDHYGRRVLEALPETAKYARIDFVVDHAGQPKLMEIEVIEPDLFLRYRPGASRLLARLMMLK